ELGLEGLGGVLRMRGRGDLPELLEHHPGEGAADDAADQTDGPVQDLRGRARGLLVSHHCSFMGCRDDADGRAQRRPMISRPTAANSAAPAAAAISPGAELSESATTCLAWVSVDCALSRAWSTCSRAWPTWSRARSLR